MNIHWDLSPSRTISLCREVTRYRFWLLFIELSDGDQQEGEIRLRIKPIFDEIVRIHNGANGICGGLLQLGPSSRYIKYVTHPSIYFDGIPGPVAGCVGHVYSLEQFTDAMH